MSFFVGRDGGFSILRVGIALGIFGALVIVGGYIFFQIDQQKYKSPLNVDLYAGSEEWRTEPGQRNTRRVIYRIPGVDPADVANFYQEELNDFYGNNAFDPAREKCVRTPSDGNFPDFVEGAGTVPYQFRCEFSESTFNFSGTSERSTTVTIQPGVLDVAENVDNTGATFVIFDQRWER